MKRWLCLALAIAMCCVQILSASAALAEETAVSAPVEANVELAEDVGLGLPAPAGDDAPAVEEPSPAEEAASAAPAEEAPADPQPGSEEAALMQKDGESIAPVDLTLSQNAVTIGVKEVYQRVVATPVPPEGAAECRTVITWRSSNAKIAKVDAASGAITGVKAGSATITAATDNGIERAVSVTVMKAPKKVTLTPVSALLGPGSRVALTPASDPKTASGVYTYQSSNTAVASVDADGVVTGVSKGVATITASSFNGVKATCRVTVLNAPTTLTFEQDPFVMAVGMRVAIPVSARDADGDEAMAGYTWSSDHPELLSFDEYGVATARAEGTATVTAASGSVTATGTVNIVPAPTDMTLAVSQLSIGLKEVCPAIEATLIAPGGVSVEASDLTWSTSNAKIVAVDPDTGVLTGVKKGSATVTARTMNGIERSAKVTVMKAPSTVTVAPAELALSEGMTGVLTPALKKNTACGAFTFNSSNPAVATADARGRVTGVSKGSATITVKTFNNKTATCKVTVYGPPASVRAPECKLVAGMTRAIEAEALDADGDPTPAGYTYAIDPSSVDPGCIALDAETGEVTGVRRGEASVIVTANGGMSATCAVRVLAAPADMVLETSAVSVMVKGTYAMPEPLLIPPAGETDCQAEITWRSANAKIARVDAQTGLVTGVKAGTTTITAATHNGIERSVSVLVGKAPTKVTLKPKKLSLEAGASERLTATLNKNAIGTISFMSSNEAVAVVDEEGLVTGISAGKATITAYTQNNKKAKCTVTVTGSAVLATVTLTPSTLSLAEGSTYRLKASVANVTYSSSDTGVAAVASDGTVSAVSGGSAVITARTAAGATATCAVTVIGAPEQVFLDAERIELAVGATRTLTATVMDAAARSGYASCAFKVLEGSDVASVDASGTVKALRAGTAVIGVTAPNGVDSHVDIRSGLSVQTRCVVVVSEGAAARIELPATLNVKLGGTATVTPVLYGTDGSALTSAEYTLSIEGDAAVLDGNVLTGVKVGTAVLTATAGSGVSATCNVVVSGARYRFFGAYEYNDKNVTGVLYFSKNNVQSMWNVLSRTKIDGTAYEKTSIMANPAKSALLSGINTAFADSTDDDVSVVYICSHGYNYIDVSSDKSMHYGIQLPGYENYKSSSQYYITAEELFSAVSAIRGRVVLIVDSCFSGVFISNMRSKLNAEGGRISVLCAATDTKASYYTSKSMSSDFDFFTYFLLEGLDYDMQKHQYGMGYSADTDGDGAITLSEFFTHAHDQVIANLPAYSGKSWFHGNPAQTPTWYAGGNADLVLFQR